MKEIKVFVVLGEIEYEGDFLVGVYSSKEKAQAVIERHEAAENHYDDYRIVESGIDDNCVKKEEKTMPNNSDLDPQNPSHSLAHQTPEEQPYDGGGWPGDGSGMDDLADYNQAEADDYCNE